MRRTIMVVLLALGGLLGVTATAGADIGDIRDLSIDDPLFGDASSVTISGTIRCQATIEYGFSGVGVAQDPADDEAFEQTSDDSHVDSDVEGVGAYGPNFDPPEGISDDSPCSQSTQGFDVLVQQNRDSGDFQDGDNMLALVIAGTSAEDGGRGPGPFIGDLLYRDSTVTFERTR